MAFDGFYSRFRHWNWKRGCPCKPWHNALFPEPQMMFVLSIKPHKMMQDLLTSFKIMNCWGPSFSTFSTCCHNYYSCKISQTEDKCVEQYVWRRAFFDQLLSFLKKSKLATVDQELTLKFDVSQSTISKYTITLVIFLYSILGYQPLWASSKQV